MISTETAMLVPTASKQKIDINSSRSSQELLLGLFVGVILGGLPDGKAESNLVDKVGKVVHQVENGVIHTAKQVSEEEAEGVDGPASSDDDAHGVERTLHMLTHLLVGASHLSSLTHEDLEQDESPSS